MFGEYLSADWDAPVVAADPAGRLFALAARDRASGDLIVDQFDAGMFRKGKYRPLVSDRIPGGFREPQLAMEGASLVLTALGRSAGFGPFRELAWFRNRNGIGWSSASLLHAEATGPGAVVLHEGRMFVAAHCRIDNQGHAVRLHGFHVGTQSTFPVVDVAAVGDDRQDGRASVAYVGLGEPAVYGAAEMDGHTFASSFDRVMIDPAR